MAKRERSLEEERMLMEGRERRFKVQKLGEVEVEDEGEGGALERKESGRWRSGEQRKMRIMPLKRSFRVAWRARQAERGGGLEVVSKRSFNARWLAVPFPSPCRCRGLPAAVIWNRKPKKR